MDIATCKIQKKIKALFKSAFGYGCDWLIELDGQPIIGLTDRETLEIGGAYSGDTYTIQVLSKELLENQIDSLEFWSNKNLVFRSELGETAILLDPKALSFEDGYTKIFIRKEKEVLQLQNTAWNNTCRIIKLILFVCACLPAVFFVSIFCPSSRTWPITRLLLLVILLSVVFGILLPILLRR